MGSCLMYMIALRRFFVMLIIVTIFAVAVSAFAINETPSTRILGGNEAAAGSTPFLVSLRLDNAHVCSGNIISENRILTAAHCTQRDNKIVAADRLLVRVGSTNQYAGGKIVAISAITVHPDYYNLKNNLAVLKLTQSLTWTDRIQPIAIATTAVDIPSVGAAVSVAGWGQTIEGTTSYKVREILLHVASTVDCRNAYSEYDSASFCLTHALKEGTCRGDGGSGAVYNEKLVGVTNFVVGACGSMYPDVFVNVTHFADWIHIQISM